MEDEILDYNWVIAHKIKLPPENSELLLQCINMDTLIATCSKLKFHQIDYEISELEEGLPNGWNKIYEIYVESNQIEAAVELLTPNAKVDSDLVSKNQNPVKELSDTKLAFTVFLVIIFLAVLFLILATL